MSLKNSKPMSENPLPFMLRRKQLADLLGVSAATIDKARLSGHFPAPIKLGSRAIGWRASDIMEWLDKQAIGR
jgi:prophage regulatory protein